LDKKKLRGFSLVDQTAPKKEQLSNHSQKLLCPGSYTQNQHKPTAPDSSPSHVAICTQANEKNAEISTIRPLTPTLHSGS